MDIKELSLENLKNLEIELGRNLVILTLREHLQKQPILTTKEQKAIANYLFFSCTKMNLRSKQAIFKINEGTYKGWFISYDIGSGNGSHKGGVWKVASNEKKLSTGNRKFTANIDLTEKIDK